MTTKPDLETLVWGLQLLPVNEWGLRGNSRYEAVDGSCRIWVQYAASPPDYLLTIHNDKDGKIIFDRHAPDGPIKELYLHVDSFSEGRPSER
jgi:hypothetical protein